MVVENLTQRKGEYREETDNVVAIRQFLTDQKIKRSESEQLKS